MSTMHAAFLIVPAVGALGALTVLPLTCHTDVTGESLDALARRVAEEKDPTAAIEALRRAGPAGLESLLALRDTISAQTTIDRLDRAIDRVAAQHDASSSRLYWYTDLEAAKVEAKRTHRPILSLRMLGKLTDELSCANSRLFRTVLYPDPDVRSMLAKDFVLHWSSEREVPVMTIEFGDGRKLVRTVTGNSIHYVLDEDGAVLDAIPGLYAPAAFADRLAWAKALHEKTPEERALLHGRYARQAVLPTPLPAGRGRDAVPAAEAVRIAVSKARIEAPLVGAPLDPLDDRSPVTLADETIALIKKQNPGLSAVELEEMIAKLKASVAQDSSSNEAVLHRRIHSRLARGERETIDTLNPWVYAELFATPAADPWLGLHDRTTFTGLTRGGVR